MIPSPTPAFSRTRCLAASLALHGLLLAAAGVAVSFLPPQIAPEPGFAGLTLSLHSDSSSSSSSSSSFSSLCPSNTNSTPAALSSLAPSPAPAVLPHLIHPTPPSVPLPFSRPSPSAPSAAANSPGPSAAGADAPALSLHCPAPPYPEAARRAGREGTVRLRVLIAPSGRVQQAEVVESSGRRDMDEAALRTVLRQWRYQPARRGGLAVAAEETVRIEFRLRAS